MINTTIPARNLEPITKELIEKAIKLAKEADVAREAYESELRREQINIFSRFKSSDSLLAKPILVVN